MFFSGFAAVSSSSSPTRANGSSSRRNPNMMNLKDLITCPITQDIMEEPVILSDGHTYEKESIVKWLQNHSTSPMTNLPLAHKNWTRNRALERIIQAYKDGALEGMNDNIPSEIRSRPILLSKDTAAYVVQSEYALMYAKWDFVDVKNDLVRGDVLWTTARYQYGDEIFVAVENYGYICQRDLRTILYSSEPFVIQAMQNIGYRFIPNNKPSAMIGENVAVLNGVVVSGSMSIKAPNGVTYYYIDGLHRGFVFDTFDDGRLAFKKVAIEKPVENSPWVLEVLGIVALRKHPDYNPDLRLCKKLKEGEMIASSKRAVGQHGDHFYWVKVEDVSGWVFVTREGETKLRVLLSVPKPISQRAGEGIIFACDRIDRWVLILNKEDINNKKTQTVQWSTAAPYSVCNQINNCTKKGRCITGVAFRNDWWYVSGEKPDGSGGFCWGNVPQKSCNAKVAIGAHDYHHNEHSYAVCHEQGGFYSNHLPSALLDTMHKAKAIHHIFLSDEDEYFIRYDNCWSWNLSNEYIRKELNSKKLNVCSVGIFDNGCWILFRENNYVCSVGLSDAGDLEALIKKHYEDHRKIVENQKKRIATYVCAVVAIQRG